MPDEKFTRCPVCRTVFRVTPQQLAIRAGQVRCGHCQAVFDGVANVLPVAASTVPSQPSAADVPYDEATMGPATMTLRTPQPGGAAAPLARVRPLDFEARFGSAERRAGVTRVLTGVGVPLLVLLLLGQALYHFRDVVAARWPVTAPVLSRLCALSGCRVEPMRDIGELAIVASELQADPAHRGLLVLAAPLRNPAAWPLQYPYLELTLTDAQDQPVVRRALLPTEYAGGAADLDGGIPANGEVPVKLFIDASATSQAGYRLYLFYP